MIHPSFKYGDNLKMGHFNVIDDSYVLSSGDCTIGNNVILRYQSVIARNVIIEDDVFFTAGVKLIFLTHNRSVTEDPLIIGRGCFLGDNAVIMGGVKIAPYCVIGACAFVNKDTEPNGVYIGIPARRVRDVTREEIESQKN